MIKKVLIFNYTGWNQIPASLIEGLKLNKDLQLFSTCRSNYGYDIMIESSRAYLAYAKLNLDADNPKLVPWILSAVLNEEEYKKECKELMDFCDLILIFDKLHKESTAHYYVGTPPNALEKPDSSGTDNTVIRNLHRHAIRNYKDKIALVDMEEEPTKAKMYGKYWGGHPDQCKVYFKAEKNMDLFWAPNVEASPFASEERYFTAGKNFDSLWEEKYLDVTCLFTGNRDQRWDKIIEYSRFENLRRGHIKEAVEKYCISCDLQFITDEKFDKSIYVEPETGETIDSKLDGIDMREIVMPYSLKYGSPVRHSSSYFSSLLSSKINIEGMPGNNAFYTGRMMETLANGCCYFYPTPSYNVDFPNGLIDNEDFVIYHSAEDLIKKIEYYLSHEDEMRTIAKNGFNKLLKYHTSEVRAKELISTCERYMCD